MEPTGEDSAQLLIRLGKAAHTHWEHTGDDAALEEAITHWRQALDLIAAYDPNRVPLLHHLGNALQSRFEANGEFADLDEGIRFCRDALDFTSDGSQASLLLLNSLAQGLSHRYVLAHNSEDIDTAVELAEEAARGVPGDSPVRAAIVHTLANCLLTRCEYDSERDDIDAAVRYAAEAVVRTDEDDPDAPLYGSTYGSALRHRFTLTRQRVDIDKAVTVCRSAVDATAPDHPRRPDYLTNYASALTVRFKYYRDDPGDIVAAVEIGTEGVDAYPPDHPARAVALLDLGMALDQWYEYDHDADHLREARRHFSAAAQAPRAAAGIRMLAAYRWGRSAGQLQDWSDAVDAYTRAVGMLPGVAWRGLDVVDRARVLARAPDLASDAAAAAFRAERPEQALDLLESGRGTLLAQALDEAGEPLDDTTGSRRIDELRSFLREGGGNDAVVVVTASRHGCDALLISQDRTKPLHLDRCGHETLLKHGAALGDVLQAGNLHKTTGLVRAQRQLNKTLLWMWQDIAEPVLNTLGVTGPPAPGEDPPRVWWCPTGALALLPLHAAGNYTEDATAPAGSVPERVVASYTPTLGYLLDAARRQREQKPSGRVLAVAAPAVPGLPHLPQAESEVLTLKRKLLMSIVLMPPFVTRDEVLGLLPKFPHFHFAGHGSQDEFTSVGGALYCDDAPVNGPLRTADLFRHHLDQAQLAFLSACETGKGLVALADESVHLGGVFQSAGFTHVVATRWSLSDEAAAEISEDFYAYSAVGRGPRCVLDVTRSAAALQHAVQRFRSQRPTSQTLLWAAYTHTGP